MLMRKNVVKYSLMGKKLQEQEVVVLPYLTEWGMNLVVFLTRQ